MYCEMKEKRSVKKNRYKRKQTVMKNLYSNMLYAMRSSGLFILTLSGITVLLISCSNSVDSFPADTSNCGPGVIVPGVCIDGVKLGDSREQVEKLLGEPSGGGLADGLYRAWRTYSYRPPGRTDGLGFSIYFIEEKDLSWGPVDMLQVHEPYDGKTPEGIGIGSTLEETLKVYGEPDYSAENELKNGKIQGSYLYCTNSRRFYVGTLNGSIEIISISFFIPVESTVYSCE